MKVGLDDFDLSMNLSLVDQSKTSYELGWWDEIRWHPFALRWEELEARERLWRRRPTLALGCPAGAFLLLARFVGTEGKKPPRERLDKVRAAFRELGFGPAALRRLVPGSVPLVEDEAYRWTDDPELGWVFGGDYPCYSLRNREHQQDGADGRFPFARFSEWTAWLHAQDRNPPVSRARAPSTGTRSASGSARGRARSRGRPRGRGRP